MTMGGERPSKKGAGFSGAQFRDSSQFRTKRVPRQGKNVRSRIFLRSTPESRGFPAASSSPVISTGAQRSGEISSPPPIVISTERSGRRNLVPVAGRFLRCAALRAAPVEMTVGGGHPSKKGAGFSGAQFRDSSQFRLKRVPCQWKNMRSRIFLRSTSESRGFPAAIPARGRPFDRGLQRLLDEREADRRSGKRRGVPGSNGTVPAPSWSAKADHPRVFAAPETKNKAWMVGLRRP